MIINRRALLKSGAAASAVALVPGLAAAGIDATSLRVQRFVFDSRFREAIEAARSVQAQGIDLSEVSGDLTSLWYNDLNLRWKEQPMTLAGVTAEDALFVLGTLAPEYRMRVVHRAEIGVAAMRSSGRFSSAPLYSWLIAPAR